MAQTVRKYTLEDGRVLNVTVEVNQWSAWIEGDPTSSVIGFPLKGVVAEAIGLNPAHDDISSEVMILAERITREIPDPDEE